MRLLFFGTYDVEAHPRVRVLIEGLGGLGHDVEEVNVPLGLDTGARVEILRRPLLAPKLVARLLGAWARLLWRSRRTPRPDAVVVGYLGLFDIHLARLRWPRVTRVLDDLAPAAGTAEDRSLGGRFALRALAAVDRAAVSAADIVAVDTEAHRDLLPSRLRGRGARVPVGAPHEWFREPLPRGEGPLRVVFFGLYTPLQGAPVIGEAIALLADEHPDVTFTMIGKGQDLDAARRAAAGHPGVRWHDWVAADELPGVVAAHDVCLGIFGTSPKAHRVVPNKVFQGAAAGCLVVTSDTTPQREALGEAGVLVTPGSGEALASCLAGLAADPGSLEGLRAASYRHARQAFAPEAAAAPLAERLAEHQAGHQAEREADDQAEHLADRQAERQAGQVAGQVAAQPTGPRPGKEGDTGGAGDD